MAAPAHQTAATTLHQARTTKTRTLKRPQKAPSSGASTGPGRAHASLDIARHPQVRRHISPPSQPAKVATTKDIAPTVHPHVAKAHAAVSTQPPTNGAVLKQDYRRRKKAQKSPAPPVATQSIPVVHPIKKQRRFSRRTLSISGASIAVGVIIVAFIIINLPALSTRIASASADITAQIPRYTPTSYTLQLPVAASEQVVTMTFRSRQSGATYTLQQSASTWDSQALRTVVERDASGRFLTTLDRGITLYTYGNNASWVNKGMLYKIEASERLDSEVIMQIANSL